MAYVRPGSGGLDYQLCRYGKSRLLVRGPKQRLVRPYTVFFGGSETFGRFVPRPFPELLAETGGLRCVNMGCVNAGVDAYADDPALVAAAAQADATVIQIPGAHNLSNRYYTVHPRRNDRFVGATRELAALYPEVDFTEFNFTRHLLTTLQRTCPDRFALVVDALQSRWMSQMCALIDRCGARTILLWIGPSHPPQEARQIASAPDPLFVDVAMVARLAARADDLVTVVPSAAACAAGTRGMVFDEVEAPVAALTAGPAVHAEIADALAKVLANHRDAA
jgi:hypothetical protein